MRDFCFVFIDVVFTKTEKKAVPMEDTFTCTFWRQINLKNIQSFETIGYFMDAMK